MRSKTSKNSTQNAPNAAQKRWEEKVIGLGPLVGYGAVELHHFLGGTTQVKGIGNLGWWAIILLTKDHHLIRHRQGRKAFEKVTGHTEKELFEKTCDRMEELPFSNEIYEAILRYHK